MIRILKFSRSKMRVLVYANICNCMLVVLNKYYDVTELLHRVEGELKHQLLIKWQNYANILKMHKNYGSLI